MILKGGGEGRTGEERGVVRKGREEVKGGRVEGGVN